MIVYVVSNTGKLLGINISFYMHIIHTTYYYNVKILVFNMKENTILTFIITVKLSML